ncbi:MAG TPA: metallophosphoesterase, partial [Alphaproteobacteria bacterium]|nr:metallophosphoesterase [Alphaproteobacteria bacterium]
MNLLFLGDIVGRSGRQIVLQQVPELRKTLALDAVIANGENAAGGFGINASILEDLYDVGVDVVTL